MIPTLLEGVTRGIFAATFTQASFKPISNHGIPCREQSSVALRTIMLPCLERRVEGSAVFATVCYSGMTLIGMLTLIGMFKTWKDSSNWDTDRSRQQSGGVTERQKISQWSRDLGEFPLGLGGCYNLKWGDAAVSRNLFWYSDQDSSISRSVMVQGKELLWEWGCNVVSWARMEIGEIVCVMISLLVQKISSESERLWWSKSLAY